MLADLRPQHSTHLHASLPRHSLLVLATALVATLTFDDPKFFAYMGHDHSSPEIENEVISRSTVRANKDNNAVGLLSILDRGQ